LLRLTSPTPPIFQWDLLRYQKILFKDHKLKLQTSNWAITWQSHLQTLHLQLLSKEMDKIFTLLTVWSLETTLTISKLLHILPLAPRLAQWVLWGCTRELEMSFTCKTVFTLFGREIFQTLKRLELYLVKTHMELIHSTWERLLITNGLEFTLI
jgi:hypothetical protein